MAVDSLVEAEVLEDSLVVQATDQVVALVEVALVAVVWGIDHLLLRDPHIDHILL